MSGQWDGRGKGSTAGNRFFMGLIRLTGVLPAYLFLFPAILSYVLFDRRVRDAVAQFRGRLGVRRSFGALYRHVYSFGMALVDRFAFLLSDRPPFKWTCIGEERISQLLRGGKGLILLSAHIGNWEIAGNLLRDRLGVPINVVLLDAEREALAAVYRDATDQRRFRTIAVSPGSSDASVEIVARLRGGEVVCMLGDRVLGGRSCRVPFLGETASLPIGPFAVALATGAPVLPVFVVKTGLRHYTFRASEPIELGVVAREERDRAISAGVARFARELESVCQRHPHQWYNFYDFWA